MSMLMRKIIVQVQIEHRCKNVNGFTGTHRHEQVVVDAKKNTIE